MCIRDRNSATTPGCLDKGHDIEHMGAMYNSTFFGVESTGTVNMVKMCIRDRCSAGSGPRAFRRMLAASVRFCATL